MEDKQIKVQILTDKLTSVLPIIDGFMNSLDEDELKLLKECK